MVRHKMATAKHTSLSRLKCLDSEVLRIIPITVYLFADNYPDEQEKSRVTSKLVPIKDSGRHVFPLAKRWLQICYDNHTQQCQTDTMERALKTTPAMRLLNIYMDLGERKVKLCSVAELGKADGHVRYSTLSHRWGFYKFLTLTKSTHADLQMVFRFQRYLKLFRTPLK
jgi:hypothetical protein